MVLMYNYTVPAEKRLFFLTLILFLITKPAFTISYPSPQGYVNDFANILKAEERTGLENLLLAIEKKTTVEIVVVTIPELGGETLEEYTHGLFNRWGIGKKGKDNGVLILVVFRERKIRIEVGYGLEPLLPDGKCGEIIRTVLTPAFQKGEFGSGLYQAAEIISSVIQGEVSTIPPQRKVSRSEPPLIFTTLFDIFWVSSCFLFTFISLGTIGLFIQTLSLLALLPYGLATGTVPFLLLIVPFLIAWVSSPVSFLVKNHRKKSLKRRYGNDWKKHWYWWYGCVPGGSKGSSGGFRGGHSGSGGFGGGSSGGGGASGGW